jgi:cell division protein ZapA (FtsZ GTPase activity inhibitor)
LSKAKPQTIEVDIYDQKYSIVLRSAIEASEVRKLAEEVDSRMRELSAASNSPDSLKVAILTALHLAQEYHELQRKCEQNDALIQSKSDEWTQALEQVLKR